ncbi:3-hydroxyisobutyrate dehydrogenase [Sphingomonas guangdongensis]|uniref:3-hydroxyisobutyrate dehydrogenase n=1 Tax=Sphingomonas guangdongensis TaxID=1141890 RepID=A0A285R2W1_9SPHN|nr:NAD(P)-dependent oxidoreductase [Sphingomonas guangdongensis]SOB88214.1 3-hydroxyisobutyrate dehydrogenase [Sphingomonas guangdongensis]
MESRFAIIGFGEAGRTLAADRNAGVSVSAYDRKLDSPATRDAIGHACRAADVTAVDTPADALSTATAVLSLVTADQALAAARQYAPLLAAGALWLDGNSVAPQTKRAAANAIEAAGGRYCDVAILAPVDPARRAVPLLVSGAHADKGVAALRQFGFTNVRAVAGEIGAASAIKMIRSVMVKGLEALTAECLLAAEAAGVRAEVLASLDASDRAVPWAARGDYNLDRMLVHGLRRAAEMEEVVATLDALGTGSVMSRGTAQRQHDIGALGLAPPRGLDAKLAALLPTAEEKAA